MIAQIGGKLAQVKTKIMLDTGALTINAISKKFYDMNKTNFNKYSELIASTSDSTLVGADGNRINFVEKRKFTIEIAKKSWEDEFYIIRDLPFEVLLGGKTMQQQGIDLLNSQGAVSCLNKKGKRTLIKYTSSKISNNKELSLVHKEKSYLKNSDSIYTLRLDQPLTLEAGTETLVTVVSSKLSSIKNKTTILVHSCEPVVDRKNIHTAQGVAYIQNGKTNIAVANLGLKKIEFKKGDLIACFVLVPDNEKVDTINVGNIYDTTTGMNSRYVNVILAAVEEVMSKRHNSHDNNPLTYEYIKEQLNKHDLPSDINIGMDHINKTQLFGLLEVLKKFKDSFAINPDQPGHVLPSVASHGIDTGDAKPINMGPRRASAAQRKVISEHIDSMIKAGIIEPSRSPWAAPVLLVPKPTIDGILKWRFCVDYRNLNAVTKKEVYALPRIDDCLDGLGGKQWFSTLDMASGYFQVPMEESSKEKTAFITYDGQYQFTKMSFGLVNAPSTYQRMMQGVLAGLQWKCLQVYLDDIIIASDNFENHLTDLTATLSRLENAGLKMKASKCEFCCSEVKYLGHLVTREGVKANPEKISKIKEWNLPDTSEELEAFVGLAGYYRKLIKDFAAREAPLRDVLKVKPFKMDKNAISAFEDIKDALSKDPVLILPDFSGKAKFELHTDASDRGISAILCQVNEKGDEQVVQYASRMLTKTELKWHTQEKEALAIVWGCQKFRSYLLGAEFLIRTDHKSLQWLWRSEKGKLARWALSMSEFEYTIEHRAGTKNVNADVLSRWPKEQPLEEFEAFPECSNGVQPERKVIVNGLATLVGCIELLPLKENKDKRKQDLVTEIQHAQKNSDSFISCMSYLLENNQTEAIEAFGYVNKMKGWQIIIHEDLLCRKKGSKTVELQVLIPCEEKKIQNCIMALNHDHPLAAHLGFTKTFAKLEGAYFWPTMKADCYNFIKSCETCQGIKSKTPNPKNRPLKPSLPNHPFERVGIDLIGPLPETQRGSVYALTMVDYFTKLAIAVPIKNKTEGEVADAIFNNLYMIYGIPEYINSDQGNEFTNDVLSRLNQRLDVGHRITTPYYPQANGLAERYNQTLKTALKAYCDEKPGTWDWYIGGVTFAYNTSLNAVTGFSPYYLIFGRQPRLPGSVLFSRNYNEIVYDVNQYQIHMTDHLRTAYDIVRTKIKEYAIKTKLNWDAKIKGHTSFEIGDEVLVFQPKTNAATGEPEHSQVWKKKWLGPYVVENKSHKDNQDVYTIKDKVTNRIWTMNVHRLIKFIPRSYLKSLPDKQDEASELLDTTLEAGKPSGDRPRIVHDEVVADPEDVTIPSGNLINQQSKNLVNQREIVHKTAHRHKSDETVQESTRRKKRKQTEDKLELLDAELTADAIKEYTIEKIITHKKKYNQIWYYVKWEGYPLTNKPEDWITISHFNAGKKEDIPILDVYWNQTSSIDRPRRFKKKI